MRTREGSYTFKALSNIVVERAALLRGTLLRALERLESPARSSVPNDACSGIQGRSSGLQTRLQLGCCRRLGSHLGRAVPGHRVPEQVVKIVLHWQCSRAIRRRGAIERCTVAIWPFSVDRGHTVTVWGAAVAMACW